MGEKIIVGPINRGLKTDRTAFIIDNDSFPVLINAYQWRGRIKRKRGTALLGRLQRQLSASQGSNIGDGISTTITTNVFTILGLNASQPNASIIPLTFKIQVGNPSIAVFEDTLGNGSLTATFGTAVSAGSSINYGTGEITLVFSAPPVSSPTFIDMKYYPTLPVMGLEDFIPNPTQFPKCIAFDTVYSYNITTAKPFNIYDVSFYKNPPDGTYPGYIAKTKWTPTTWNGQNYQQFWTTNYLGALWATSGIDIPFNGTTIGMQFKPITNKPAMPGTGVVIITAGNGDTIAAVANIHIVTHGLVKGDFVFINEVQGITGINFQTGYVTNVIDADNIEVTFPKAILGGAYTSGGIAQYLTNRSDIKKDCLRWYDGDPTNGIPPNPSSSLGWVNFAPPLSEFSYSIADLVPAQYYLVGARMILPFKDRLLFIGPVIQTSTGNPIYLQDTVIYSQNGTPYYTCSFSGDFFNPTFGFTPILVPVGQTATPSAYWEDQTGFGGFVSSGLDQPIATASGNEDVLILGLATVQTRLVYSGNDIIPFNFYIINSELGSGSTFSTINMDQGVITRGGRGFIITAQTNAKRIDLDIPDQVFQIRNINNGPERLCAQRDYINEWIYFTYPSNLLTYDFPNQTLQYNYRDDSWAIFNECYTTYGTFRISSGKTWLTTGFSSWLDWNEPWNAGGSTLLNPEVIAGNQQGFVVFRDQGTSESVSLAIQSISGNVITSPNHCLNQNDFILISGAIGTVAPLINGKIFQVATLDTNTITLNPSFGSGTYFGGGLITRIYNPFIQTKQFPVAWQMARKTRLGPQQYLLTATTNSQITLLIFLSQNNEFAYNDSPIIPDINSINDSLIYSTILYTCPESTNLGLTPANINLQMITEPQTGSSQQAQIWHRMNTSLIGDTVQIGFTMSNDQLKDLDDNGLPISQFSEIELHSFILDVNPSQVLV